MAYPYTRSRARGEVADSDIELSDPVPVCRHLEFSKIRNFNGLSAVGGQYASSGQILSKSVKRLQVYRDLTVFKMAAVRHFGFVKFEFFNGRSGKRPILHQRTKFRKDRSNRYGDIAIFVIFSRWRPPPFWIFKNSKFIQ